MDCNRARALAIPDVKAKSAGKGFCGACRGRGAVGPRADEPGPYLPHGAAPGAPCASMSSPLWCGRTFFYAIYGRMSHLGGGGGARAQHTRCCSTTARRLAHGRLRGLPVRPGWLVTKQAPPQAHLEQRQPELQRRGVEVSCQRIQALQKQARRPQQSGSASGGGRRGARARRRSGRGGRRRPGGAAVPALADLLHGTDWYVARLALARAEPGKTWLGQWLSC